MVEAPAARPRSLVLRYALLYAAVLVLSLAAVLGGLYVATVAARDAQLDADVAADAHHLGRELVGLSVTQMAAVVTRRSEETPGASTVYMLATERREYVAGNLRTWPEAGSEAGAESAEPFEFPLDGDDAAAPRVRARVVPVASGLRVLVGRNTAELDALQRRLARALVWMPPLVLLLGAAGGWLLSRRVAARLDAINENAAAILGGELGRRMPVSDRGDELDDPGSRSPGAGAPPGRPAVVRSGTSSRGRRHSRRRSRPVPRACRARARA